MRIAMLSLEQQLNELGAVMESFRASAWFEPEMDQLVYLTEDCAYRAERVDALFTLLWHPYEDRVVGAKIKGFRWVYELLTEQGKVERGGFLSMMNIIEIVWTAAAGFEASERRKSPSPALNEQRAKKYGLALGIANYDVPVSELSMAA
ncbi:MAG: hypothetical protein HQL39_09770 [Alphaproteobacteria bacterium]|nr:hypothetical protein [Alphaproteobacteria bacterium]